MFSANENIMLREHKKRIVAFVEDCIPEEVKDAGTMVMVMQLTCQAPGCVPLETAVIVIFPPSDHELLPGLPQSGGTTNNNNKQNNSGNFQTKILKPMAEVTRDDVLDALPPAFLGGRRTMEKLCVKARDVMLAQITQIMGDNDQEGRQLMAQYLIDCLQEYMQRDCVAPEYGEPFPVISNEQEDVIMTTSTTTPTTTPESQTTNSTTTMTTIPGTGNLVIRRTLNGDHENANNNNKSVASTAPTLVSSSATTPLSTTTASSTVASASATLSSATRTAPAAPAAPVAPSQMDWRNHQRQQGLLSSNASGSSIVARLSEREHAPGIRRPGCPCCDPDNISNLLDKMMTM